MSRPVARALGLLVLAFATVGRAAAQQAVDKPAKRAGPPLSALDSAKARRDSLKKVPIVKWDPADSVGERLMSRKGYNVIRYRADTVTFGAQTRVIAMRSTEGERSAVQREPSILVARSIDYIDTASTLRASGDQIRLRDPQQAEDIEIRDSLAYNYKDQTGKMKDFASAAKQGSDIWNVTAHRGGFASDTTAEKENAIYGLQGTMTSCDDSTLHYHFAVGEFKRISNNTMVARDVTMYVMGVPVMKFPFIFQDTRSGRRSGILTPRFGFAELVRNSPTYRRNIENVGYYFALSDYYDASLALDWRSAANATSIDPGWVRMNGEFRYFVRDYFVTGRLAVSQHVLSSGSSNTSFTWTHAQDFSIHSKLTANVNYVTSTTIQRQTAINPASVLATIGSQVNYQRDFGVMQLAVGGSQRQYPGRPQVDREFPNVNITSKPIDVTKWLVWTPSLQFGTSQSLHMDAQGDFTTVLSPRSDGTFDSLKVDHSTRTSQLAFNTPFKLFDWSVSLALRVQDRANNYPELRTIVDPADSSKRSTRIYKRTYLTSADLDLNFQMPTIDFKKIPGLARWNISPSIALANIDPGPMFVRSERSGSKWASQGKRWSYGLSISPTFFGLFDVKIGAVEKLRHSINTQLQWSYASAKSVATDYLTAQGKSPLGYLGSLAQNRVTLGFSTNLEAKLKQGGDSAITHPEAAKKIKALSLTFTPISWDFEKAKKVKSGIATDRFGTTVRSDLLPGFDFGLDYSLFQGSILSDTAKFSPYLENMRASMSIGPTSPIIAYITRLFGGEPRTARDSAAADSAGRRSADRNAGSQSVAGQQSTRSRQMDVPNGRGFDMSLSYSHSQSRPPTGSNVVEYDPTRICLPIRDLNPIQYDICVRNALAAPPQQQTNTQTTAGGTVFRYPGQTNIQFRTSFNLTPKWATQWSTNYDLERKEFGSQQVALVRDMHDWRANFGFTQAPNGAFAFTFFVSLKAEPDLKFDYNRSSYRQSGTGIP